MTRLLLAVILIFCTAFCIPAFATVPSDASTVAGPYACDGSDTTFTIPSTLGLDDDDDLQVIRITVATGAETVLTKTTDYAITSAVTNDPQNLTQGGTVTLVTAPSSDYQIFLRRATTKTQPTNIDDEDVEAALDKLTRIVQDLSFILGLCLKVQPTETGDTVQFPAAGTAGYAYRAANGAWTTATTVDDSALTVGTAWQGILAVTPPMFVVTAAPYDATGNGTTDDTAAIQAALTAGTGGTVLFPPGTYLTDTLTVSSNTHVIIMEGAEVKLKDSASGNISAFYFTGDNIHFSGTGTINVNGAGNPADSRAIYGNAATTGYDGNDISIEGLRIIDAVDRGILLYYYDHVRIRDVTLQATAAAPTPVAFNIGIHVNGSATAGRECNDITVTGCHLLGNGTQGDGIAYTYGSETVTANNTIDTWGRSSYSSYAIDVELTTYGHHTITGNTITHSYGGIAAKSKTVVTGNLMVGSNGNNGIVVNGDDVQVIGNTVLSPYQNGISVSTGSDRVKITNNQIYQPSVQGTAWQAGIKLAGTHADVDVGGNTIIGGGALSANIVGIMGIGNASQVSGAIHGNVIKGINASVAIYAKDVASNFAITGNLIDDCSYGITLGILAGAGATGVVVANNVVSNIDNAAITIENSAYTSTQVTGNQFASITGKKINDVGTTTNIAWSIYGSDAAAGSLDLYDDSDIGATAYIRESVAHVDLTNAQIKDLADTPIQLVAAPGAGKWLELCGASLWLDYGTNGLTEPSTPDDLRIEYDSGTGPAASATITASGFITATADTGAFAIPVSVAGTAATSIVNKNLALVNLSNDYTGNAANDTVIRVIVRYRVHTALGL